MKNQVLSIEQMQELKELGIDTSKASMYYYHGEELTMKDDYYDDFGFEQFGDIPTFTLQDILEMLPKKIRQSYRNGKVIETSYLQITIDYDGQFKIEYTNDIMEYGHDECGNLLDAAFGMLKWCKQKKYL